ncbi:bacteriohemerythrin [Salinispira pacifica]|uniref:Hemerythrin-like metal-binding protein n=1 Tax=Salinispira pacifica TaxID=1307761 RepID=V5WL88_9SPIO|nr:bacteriohemerythrin [Salinispira pacifica]AHC16577.1 hemerythrin-like metal-binding protein [Salinispira pacifica]
MALLEWTDDMSVGNPIIDTQHRRLIDLVNDFHRALENGRGQESISFVLDNLNDYIEMHFRSEEALFRISDYPEKDAHMEEHRRLMERVEEYLKRFKSGNKYLTVEILDFIQEWVEHHIKVTDAGYKDYI